MGQKYSTGEKESLTGASIFSLYPQGSVLSPLAEGGPTEAVRQVSGGEGSCIRKREPFKTCLVDSSKSKQGSSHPPKLDHLPRHSLAPWSPSWRGTTSPPSVAQWFVITLPQLGLSCMWNVTSFGGPKSCQKSSCLEVYGLKARHSGSSVSLCTSGCCANRVQSWKFPAG